MGIAYGQAPSTSWVVEPNKFYVNLDNGDDATAIEGSRLLPYKTVQQAIDDADATGNKCVVVIVNTAGNYSTETVAMKGDVSLMVENAILLPTPRTGESSTRPTVQAVWLGVTNQWVSVGYGTSQRVYLGAVTINSDWAVGNQVSGFNCTSITVKNDLTNTSTASQKNSANQFRFFNILVEGDISLDELTSSVVYGEWERIIVDGNCFNTSEGAGTIVGGYWQDCAVKDKAWQAETVNGVWKYCWVFAGGAWGEGQDFTGYCYRCWADCPINGVWGANGGDMSGTLEECVVIGSVGLTDQATVSGSILGGYFENITNLGSGISGTFYNGEVIDGYIILIGTMRNVIWNAVGANTHRLFENALIDNCEITIDNIRAFGGNSALLDCKGVIRNTRITHEAGATVPPIQATDTTTTNILILDNVTIITDYDYAVSAGLNNEDVILLDVKSNAGTAVLQDPPVFHNAGYVWNGTETNNVYQVTGNLR